ncbi:baseplate J/gp47 family protein [Acinetobacter sp. V91_7]|uniref:baseplate J/gp47 family protein n=1 Tax=unclassified Acinetobacter TaxID=196816 RepID=UPI00287E0584|nr:MULTISPECIES: baseplate J/gp47 family protein [unclassified Acinetobacter]MDS7935678.1 baseplate J/gp47 family protein [Acinetobacter sp. V91_4B]MDS7964714.1 baseplate J/gp47 family protein [Acinetobacter sp. V91_7]MDS8025591.1 baseplate J/gp47 family protein [Acinetobacter sp. V91_13]
MSIPKLEITEKGIYAPPTEAVLAGAWEMLKGAFGNNLTEDLRTPQGQLVTSITAMVQDERNQMIELLNLTDPRYSKGVWQDGIGHIYFLERKRQTRSTAVLIAMGLKGAKIPRGTQFLDVSGLLWECSTDAVIGEHGVTTINVHCLTAGTIKAAPNTINRFLKVIPGIDRVFNEAAAIEGREEESHIDFEERRRESVAANSKNTNAATYGAVADLENVISVFVVDNPTDETVLVGSTDYPVIRNSILVSVVGGDELDIAKMALTKAGSGCSFNGNTEVTIKDTDNFPERPPVYKVKILRPQHIPIYFKIRLEDETAMSIKDEKAMKKAIVDAMQSGKSKAKIGHPVVALRFVCQVTAVTSLILESIQISRDHLNFNDVLDFGVDEFPFTTEDYIEFV